MNIIDDILERARFHYGVNPRAWDRLFKGNNEKATFFSALIRERGEMIAALDTASHLIAERDAELADLREAVKASGVLSMGLGEKRKDSE